MKNEKRKRHFVDWKDSVEAHQALCRMARNRSKSLNGQAAIHRKSKMVGKIVVVKP